MFVNDKPFEFSGNIIELLKELNLNPETTAVLVNNKIVPKAEFERTIVGDDDYVETISFVGGG